jgi:hypothetical protein
LPGVEVAVVPDSHCIVAERYELIFYFGLEHFVDGVAVFFEGGDYFCVVIAKYVYYGAVH